MEPRKRWHCIKHNLVTPRPRMSVYYAITPERDGEALKWKWLLVYIMGITVLYHGGTTADIETETCWRILKRLCALHLSPCGKSPAFSFKCRLTPFTHGDEELWNIMVMVQPLRPLKHPTAFHASGFSLAVSTNASPRPPGLAPLGVMCVLLNSTLTPQHPTPPPDPLVAKGCPSPEPHPSL